MPRPITARSRPSPPPSPSPQPLASHGKPRATKHLGHVLVRRTNYQGESQVSEVEDLDEITIPVFSQHVANVSVAASVTKNLGDFNSCKVHASVSLPCLPELSEIDRTYEILSAKIEELIRSELTAATGVPH